MANSQINVLENVKAGGVLEHTGQLSEQYTTICDINLRKIKGQFFTPDKVSRFMANLFEIKQDTIRLLDPGAGTGMLIAAFCENLLNLGVKNIYLTVDAYENDSGVLSVLKDVLEDCKKRLINAGNEFQYNIYQEDFILYNERYLEKPNLFWANSKNNNVLYDFVICNPPYYKLNKSSSQSIAMSEIVSGQPNIYALFMALSAHMLDTGGEMVFITPRSFCSGLYYKKFREWILKNVKVTNIHIFESRKDVFDKDNVLQENVIIKLKKTDKNDRITVTSSETKSFDNTKKITVPYDNAIYHKNGDTFIRIPTTLLDLEILHTIDTWPKTLKELGLEISTGPVVPFRAEKHLISKLTEKQEAPLIWMHNLQNTKVVYPLKKSGKQEAIRICDETKSLLLPLKNYVLLKRFSSKEQKKRLYAAVLLESEFPYKTIGLENHVNYIHKPNGTLSVYEVLGIAAILNTNIVDSFFRTFNGNTQVNATDIRSLPLPSIEDIIKIGKMVCKIKPQNEHDLDRIVGEVLNISPKIIKNKNGRKNLKCLK
ncbi:MAG: Eco57I restriction-modification methylase domain-containing protein [bacterium]